MSKVRAEEALFERLKGARGEALAKAFFPSPRSPLKYRGGRRIDVTPALEEYACGICLLERMDAREKAFTRSRSGMPIAGACARRLVGSPVAPAGDDNGSTPGYGPWQQGARPIALDEWKAHGFSVKTIPEGLIIEREDRDLCARILAKSPGRSRGRPPIGDKATTGAERTRKYRLKEDA
jgi:hypothetical protein